MAQRMTAIVPVISNRCISRCPIFEVRARICRPPVDFCFGTRPHRAANSRPFENSSIGGAKAGMVVAHIGPTPGAVISRDVASSVFSRPLIS